MTRCDPGNLLVFLFSVAAVTSGCASTENNDFVGTQAADTLLDVVTASPINCARQSPTAIDGIWGAGQILRACLAQSPAEAASCVDTFFAQRAWPYVQGNTTMWMFCNNGRADATIWIRHQTSRDVRVRPFLCAPAHQYSEELDYSLYSSVEIVRRVGSLVTPMLDVELALLRRYSGQTSQTCIESYDAMTDTCGPIACAPHGNNLWFVENDGELTRYVLAILRAGGMSTTLAERLAAAMTLRLRDEAPQQAALLAAFYLASEGDGFPPAE